MAIQRSRPYGLAYRSYRNTLYMALYPYRNPGPPLEAAWIEITLRLPRAVDIDSKYAMVYPLLDVLQPERLNVQKGQVVPGLGWIANDTDGEGGLGGCIKGLTVRQVIVPKKQQGFHVIIKPEP